MQQTTLITMTPEAVRRLKEFMDEQGMPDAYLRVFVAPGGCSGLQYGMALEESAEEDDFTFEIDGVRVIVDPFSATYLEGAEIDYVNSLMRPQLRCRWQCRNGTGLRLWRRLVILVRFCEARAHDGSFPFWELPLYFL